MLGVNNLDRSLRLVNSLPRPERFAFIKLNHFTRHRGNVMSGVTDRILPYWVTRAGRQRSLLADGIFLAPPDKSMNSATGR